MRRRRRATRNRARAPRRARGDHHVRRVAAEAAHVGVGIIGARRLNSTIASPMATIAARSRAAPGHCASQRDRRPLRQRAERRGISGGSGAHVFHRRARAGRDSIPCRSRSRRPPNTDPCCRAGCHRPENQGFARQHRTPGLQRRRRQLIGGKHLQAVGTGVERGKRLGRRRDARNAYQSLPLRLANHVGIGMRHDDEAARRPRRLAPPPRPR